MKFTTNALAILLVSLSSSSPALAWDKLDNYDLYVHSESITKETGKDKKKQVNVWIMYDLDKPFPFNGAEGRSIKALEMINCDDRTYTWSPSHLYSGKAASGDLLAKSVPGFPFGESIVPDTMHDALHKKYCKSWWKAW